MDRGVIEAGPPRASGMAAATVRQKPQKEPEKQRQAGAPAEGPQSRNQSLPSGGNWQ